MAKTIKRASQHSTRLMLVMLNGMLAFVLGIIGSVSAGSKSGLALLKKSAGFEVVQPDYGAVALYGVQPVYGVPEYGVIPKQVIKGVVANLKTKEVVEDIKVILKNEKGTQILDSTITDCEGKYFFDLTPSFWLGQWQLSFSDDDKDRQGGYKAADTLLSSQNRTVINDTLLYQVDVMLEQEQTALSIGASPQKPVAKFQWSGRENGFIGFQIDSPQSGNARLDIYDERGRRLSAIFETYLPKGVYRHRWNAARLPRGIYYFQLKINGQAIIRKGLI